LTGLTPGDFALVQKKAGILGCATDPEQIVELLRQELDQKQYKQAKAIGFGRLQCAETSNKRWGELRSNRNLDNWLYYRSFMLIFVLCPLSSGRVHSSLHFVIGLDKMLHIANDDW